MTAPRLGLVLVLSLAAGPAFGQERVDGDLYVNPRYGIQIGKPSSWHFITARTLLDLARQAGGAAPVGREEDPVRLTGIAVIVSKAPTLGRTFEPQVVVLVHQLAAPPADLVKACEGLRSGMTDPKTVKPTREVRIDGKRAARLDFQGLVDDAAVRATALCTLRDWRAFIVVGQALSADFAGEASAFETILGSFRLK